MYVLLVKVTVVNISFFLVLLEFQKTLYAYVRNVLYVRLVIVTVGNHVF
jgi:hypothetical protein